MVVYAPLKGTADNYRGQTMTYSKLSAAAFLTLILTAGSVLADSMPPTIMYDSALYSKGVNGRPPTLHVVVMDDQKVRDVTLYFRNADEETYKTLYMKRDREGYYETIPYTLDISNKIEYYILAQDESGNTSTSPQGDARENPYTITLSEDSTPVPGINMSNPESGAELEDPNQYVIISFAEVTNPIDMKTARIVIDNVDVTSRSDKVGQIIIYTPRRPFQEGIHEVQASIKDTQGVDIGTNIYHFTILEEKGRPLDAKGDFYLGIEMDDRSNRSETTPLWDNQIRLNVDGRLGNRTVWRAGVNLSSDETKFMTTEDIPKRQPINRYFFNLKTGWWKQSGMDITIGDAFPVMSDLTLKGVLVRGFGTKIDLGPFHTQVHYGFTKRSLDPTFERVSDASNIFYDDSLGMVQYTEDGEINTVASNERAYFDPINGSSLYRFQQGTFERKITALRLAFDMSRFVDLGLNFLSVEDDTTSLNYDRTNPERPHTFAIADSIWNLDTKYEPKKNYVMSFDTHFKFNRSQTVLGFEIGQTIVTNNVYSVLDSSLMDEVPDIDEEIIKINASTQTSWDKNKIKDYLDDDDYAKIVPAIFSPLYRLTFKTPIPIPKAKTTFNFEQFRTPTHYVSLGNPQQQVDQGGYRLTLRSRTWNNQLSMNFAYDDYDDNLDSEIQQIKYFSAADTLYEDLTKNISSMSIGFTLMPQYWPDYAPSLNFGIKNYNAANNINYAVNDTTRGMDTKTNSFNIGLSGRLPLGVTVSNLRVNISNLSIRDERPVDNSMKSDSDNNSIMISDRTELQIVPLSLNGTLGQTTTKNIASGVETKILLFNLTGTYKLMRERLKATVGIGYIGSDNGISVMKGTAAPVDNNKLSINFGAEYKLKGRNSIYAGFRYITYSDKIDSGKDYNEPILTVILKHSI